MNKKAIYNFIKKINSAKNKKDLAAIVNESFIELTGACACWFGLINWNSNQLELRKIMTTEEFDNDEKLICDVKKIRQTIYDCFNNFEIEDIKDYMVMLSQNNKILLPLKFKKSIPGYIGMISKDSKFNKKHIKTVMILMEYINAKLEILLLNEEKKQYIKERTEFLATVSHELKTPLNSIIGFSELLAQKFIKNENLKYLTNILQNASYLMDLINYILEYAKTEHAPLKITLEKFRPKQIINDIIWSFDEKRKEKNVKILYTLSDITINADLIRFKQLTYNLISNAIKFSKPGGTISIVTYKNDNKEFIFEIKDNGDGISKKDTAKIFNFFTQANRSQLKRQQGSGIGLALCRKILQAHGGEIYVKSRLHHGSTFWFTIPQKH